MKIAVDVIFIYYCSISQTNILLSFWQGTSSDLLEEPETPSP